MKETHEHCETSLTLSAIFELLLTHANGRGLKAPDLVYGVEISEEKYIRLCHSTLHCCTFSLSHCIDVSFVLNFHGIFFFHYRRSSQADEIETKFRRVKPQEFQFNDE